MVIFNSYVKLPEGKGKKYPSVVVLQCREKLWETWVDNTYKYQFEEQLWETWYTIDCLSVSKNCRIL
jgi:hypothetical protein